MLLRWNLLRTWREDLSLRKIHPVPQKNAPEPLFTKQSRSVFNSGFPERLSNREFVNGGGVIFLTSVHCARGEIGVVRSIREILGFQAECMMVFHNNAVFAFAVRRKFIGGIKLNSRQIAEYFHHTATFRLISFCNFLDAGPFACQYKVVVIAVGRIHQTVRRVDRCV